MVLGQKILKVSLTDGSPLGILVQIKAKYAAK